MADYDGPQTVEALMAEFDENYSRTHSQPGSELDMLFPRDEWIQRALDLGVVFPRQLRLRRNYAGARGY